MAFFRNDAVNRVYIHSAIFAFAQAGAAVFFFAILLRTGVSVPAALALQAAIMAVRFVLRPASLPLGKIWGLKPLTISGTLLMSLQFPLLAAIDGVGWGLIALCLVAALGEVFYWPSVNAYFAALGDPEHRGSQVSAREAFTVAAGIVAPLLGAYSLITFGPGPMLVAAALVQAAAALPLIGAPNVPVPASAPGALRAARFSILLYAADGWTDAFYIYVWQIALFLTLGENIAAYGGAMAAAGAVGAVAGLLLGRRIDAGRGRNAVALVFGAAAAVMALRAASVDAPALAVLANALGPLAMTLMSPLLSVANYNLAKASPCALRFLIAADGGWDIGCAIACLIAAALTAAHLPLSLALILAIPALGAQALLLRLYYATHRPRKIACDRIDNLTEQ